MKAKVFQAITQAWVNEHLDKQACGSRLETDGLGGAGPGLVLRSVKEEGDIPDAPLDWLL